MPVRVHAGICKMLLRKTDVGTPSFTLISKRHLFNNDVILSRSHWLDNTTYYDVAIKNQYFLKLKNLFVILN